MLRKRFTPAFSVQGAKDEAEPLLRLSDAVCGLLRDSRNEKSDMQALLARGKRRGVFHDLNEAQKNRRAKSRGRIVNVPIVGRPPYDGLHPHFHLKYTPG